MLEDVHRRFWANQKPGNRKVPVKADLFLRGGTLGGITKKETAAEGGSGGIKRRTPWSGGYSRWVNRFSPGKTQPKVKQKLGGGQQKRLAVKTVKF